MNKLHETAMQLHSKRKRGVIIPFLAVGFVLILIMLLFTVDLAYIQMVRTELRVTTDVAAKAGVESLRRTQDPDQAIKAVMDYASKNQVAGNPLLISEENIVLGQSLPQSDNSWVFEPGVKPYNAVKVDTVIGGDSGNPAVNLFFGKFWGSAAFTPRDTAVASNSEVEVILCIDRSHSMCFDMSGVDWKYPTGIPPFLSFIYPPHSTKSRWAALSSSVSVFTDSVKDQVPNPRVGLVTWGSLIDSSTYEGGVTGLSFPIVNVDETLTLTYTDIKSKVNNRSIIPMLGGTTMSAGIDEAVNQLEQPTVKASASKVIILFTDGLWNKGFDPVLSAQNAKDKGIVIHTVGLLDAANTTKTLKDIANITGGRYYIATDKAELEAAFLELSRMLPVALTE